MTIYSYKTVDKLINKYAEHTDNFNNGGIIEFYGSLCDNYILYGDGLRTTIIREKYLNEWSSGNTIIMYNKTPKKYQRIIDLWLDGEEEKAEKLFFAR